MTASLWNPSGVTLLQNSIFSHAAEYLSGTVGEKLQKIVTLTDAPFNTPNDGTGNATQGLRDALDKIYDQGGGILYAPRGRYLIDEDIEPQINGTASRFFCLVGQGMEQTQFITPNGSSLKIYTDTPPARTNAFVSTVLEMFTWTNSSGILTTPGIDIYSMQRSRFSALRVTGFDAGLKLRSAWNNTINNRCQFVENNVGIKFPRTGSGITLNEGLNSIDIVGISCANNNKAGMSIAACNVITADNILLESCPVGIYVVEAAQKLTFRDLYYEAGSLPDTYKQNDRLGDKRTFVIYCGKDEEGNIGDTALPIKNIDITHAMRNFGDGVIYIDNVDTLRVNSDEINRSYVILGDNVSNIDLTGVAGTNATANALTNIGHQEAKSVLRKGNHNLIPNGNFKYPGLPFVALTANAGTTLAEIVEVTLPLIGSTRALEVTIPAAATTASLRFDFSARTGVSFQKYAGAIAAAIRVVSTDANITAVSLSVKDSAGNAEGSATKNAPSTSEPFVLSNEMDMNRYIATSNGGLISITITKNITGADVILYLDEIVVWQTKYGTLELNSVMDQDCGLSGRATCNIADGGNFKSAVIDSGISLPDYFEVTATLVYDAGVAATYVKVEKLAGGDAGKFVLRSDVTGAIAAYRVLPKVVTAS